MPTGPRKSAPYLFLPALLLLAGCGAAPTLHPVAVPASLSGEIHGGQQPVIGASIQLYAAGSTGDGSAATPLLATPALSGAGGTFNITGAYTCPSASSLVYILATGGNPGLGTSTNNSALALTAALGPCGNLSASTFISLNEVTTVAAAYALAPYASSPTAIGSASSDAPSLTAAFTLANQFANTATGSAPGNGVPAGYAVPVAQIYTIADIIASCVNSPGGVAGDGSICGTLFNLTTQPPVTPAADTFTALLHLALNPTLNTAGLYSLISPAAPFQPTQPSVPSDLNLYLTQPGVAALQFTPAVVTFAPISATYTSPRQLVTVESTGTLPVAFSPVTVTGANASDFAQTNNCVSPLAPGTACTIQLTATPAAVGPGTATLQFASSAATSPQSISLSETGTAPTGGIVTVSPTHLSWSVANTFQDITLTNSGTTTLNLAGIVSSESTFKVYSNTCGSQVPPLSTCTIVVQSTAFDLNSSTLTPQTHTGTLTITDDAAAGPQTVALSSTNSDSVTNPILFGAPAVGTSSILVEQVNAIMTTLTASFTGTVFGPNAADFSAAGCNGMGIAPASDQCTFPITFTPGAPGIRTAKYGASNGYILLTGGSGSETVGSLSLTGPSFIAPATTGNFTLTNLGPTDVGISSISVGGYTLQGSQTFAQTNVCGAVLPAQSVCNITVSASAGSFSSATLNVTAGPGVVSAPINLFPAAFISPPGNPATFGSYAIGATSVTVSGVGKAASAPSPLSLQGNAADFTATPGTCVYASGGCTYNYAASFAPTALGLRSASFTDLYGTHAFTGFGLSPGPSFSIAQEGQTYMSNNIAFNLYLGSAFAYTLDLVNTGTTSLNITRAITGTDAAAFSISPSCSSLLFTAHTPATSCALTLTANPTHLGLSTATLTVTDTLSGFSYTLNLSANAVPPLPYATPSSLTFSNTPVTTASAVQYLTFTDYYHGTISLSSSTGSAFSIVGPATCGPAPCQIGIAFTPTAVGYTSANLTFTDSTSAGNNINVGVSGTGTGSPAVSLSPTSITFPARPLNSTSIPVPVTLTNTGTATLTVSSISIPAAVAGNFTQTSNCTTVAVNATCTIDITFAPTTAGAQSATLNIVSNALASPATLSLSGSTN